MWDLNKDYGFSTSVKDFPGSDFNVDWKNIGDYTNLSGQPYSSSFDSSFGRDRTDGWQQIAKALNKSNRWRDRNTYRDQGQYKYPIQSSPNIAQIGPDSILYMPQQQQFDPSMLPQSSGGSSSGGMFGKIGGLAGTVGTAAGVFGPLGTAVGAGVGGLIDAFT